MQYRVNPRNGDRISALGLGCMRFPGALGHPDPHRASQIVARAVERGINYLDTAYLYPGNEACVGMVLEELGLRDRVFIATKLPHGSVDSAVDLDRIFDEQLRRLRTDHIDYYLIHNVTSPAQWERLRGLGIEGWLACQRETGRIRQAGFSYHGSEGDFPVLLDAHDWDFCQIQYNYVGEKYQAGTAGLCAAAERGLAVFVMEPLLGGRLAVRLPDRARRILDAAAEPGLQTPAAWGLSWVWDHPEVTMLLSGMASPEQVDENAAVAERALPGSLTSVGANAFNGCTALTSVRCEATTPPAAVINSFLDVDMNACTLYVPESSVNAYESAPVWQYFYHITAALPTGIQGAPTTETAPRVEARFDLNGRPADSRQRGIQLQRMSDGTWRKVLRP